MKTPTILLSAALALALAGGAHAAPFGPATGATVTLGSPTVTLGVLSGTESFNSPAAIFSTTGSLTAAAGPGTTLGTISFSELTGSTVAESLPAFLTFADTSGGTFVFDASSVTTLSFHTTPTSTSFALYLLGTAQDANLGLTPAATSVTLTSNETAGSAYSSSGSIASPPALISAAPEPSTWALMFAGVFGIGLALRQAGRNRRLPAQAISV